MNFSGDSISAVVAALPLFAINVVVLLRALYNSKMSLENNKHLQEIHVIINSRLDEFIKAQSRASYEAGIKTGVAAAMPGVIDAAKQEGKTDVS